MALRVGLVGFGTVGQSVARLLTRDDNRRARLVRVCGRAGGRDRPQWLPRPVEWTTTFDDLLARDIDIVVELVGGIQPARQWLHKALLAGKSVVTANKLLVAEHGPELQALADRQACRFRFEGAVGGGIPVIRAIEDGLAGDRLVRVTGVLNGTCNYVLTRIEQAGLPFAEALREARELGYAEADASADIEGYDARAKLAILCQVAFGIRVRPADIACESIAGISLADFERARADGFTVRQLSTAVRGEGPSREVVASVRPALVPLEAAPSRRQKAARTWCRSAASSGARRSSPARAPVATRPRWRSSRTCSPLPPGNGVRPRFRAARLQFLQRRGAAVSR